MTGSHHANPVAGEAVIIALLHRQWVLKISGADSPVDLIAFDTIGLTLVHAVRSKKPINDAHTAMEAYSDDIAALDAVGQGVPCNRALWITSRPCGWVWYEVARGNLARMDKPFSPQIPVHVGRFVQGTGHRSSDPHVGSAGFKIRNSKIPGNDPRD